MGKLLFVDLMGNTPRGLKKGSEKAKTAGQKAAETRRRNRENGVERTKSKPGPKSLGIIREKITFKALNESNYHKISINSPVDIFVHKSLTRMYISPLMTKIENV